MKLSVFIRRFLCQPLRGGDRGATAVEYGLMVALVAAVIAAVVTLLGTHLRTEFNTIVNAL